jgi:hypothetical protein
MFSSASRTNGNKPTVTSEHKAQSPGRGETNTVWRKIATYTGTDNLTIGEPDSRHEKEADQVANKVSRGDVTSKTPVAPAMIGSVARKPVAPHGKSSTIAKATRDAVANPGHGMPMENGLREQSETLLNMDLSHVLVHNDGRANAAADAIQAKAFTHNHHIWLGSGQSSSNTHLMAHETAHVAQQTTGSPLIQRNPLGVEVPEIGDPASMPELDTQYDYQWQNKVLLDTVYDDKETQGHERLNSLRQFLYIERELELKGRFTGEGDKLSDEEAKALAAEEKGKLEIALSRAEQAITDKTNQIKINKAEIKANRGKLKSAKADKRRALKRGSRAAEVANMRNKATKKINQEQTRVNKADKNLAWAEKRKKSMGEKKYTQQVVYWSGVKVKSLNNIFIQQGTIAMTQTEYDTLIAPYDINIAAIQNHQDALARDNKQSAAEIREAKANIKALNSEIATIARVSKGDASAIMSWKMNRYTRELKGKDHLKLLEEIQTLFDKDDGSRFPPWVRYAVIHMSGMRYAGAHNSWYSPRRLLTLLKEIEVQEAGTLDRNIMMGEGQTWLEAHPNMKGIGLNYYDKRALKSTGLEGMKKKLGDKDEVLYEEIESRQTDLYKLYTRLRGSDSCTEATNDIFKQITWLEKKIASFEEKMSDKGKRQVKKAKARREALLLSIYEKRAKSKINMLNDRQALAVLKQMKDSGAIPAPVWREISVFTHLRLDVTDPGWEEMKKNRGLKGVEAKTPAEKAELDSWRDILSKKGFYKNLTGWRAHHAETLSPSITASIVCDQLGSYIQHTRGHKRKGGLRNNAMYYLDQQQASSGKSGGFFGGVLGGLGNLLLLPLLGTRTAPYFRAPKSHHDFRPGASLYWMSWSQPSMEAEYMKVWKKYNRAKQGLDYLKRRQGRDQGKYDRKKTRKGVESPYYGSSYRDRLAKGLATRQDKISDARKLVDNLKKDMDSMRAFKPEKTKVPDISNIVSPTSSKGGVHRIGKLSFTDGSVDSEGWKYRIQKQVINGREVTSIMRAKLNAADCASKTCKLEFSTTPNPDVVKQWLKYTHEATVMHANEQWTITFNTSTKFDSQKVKGMGANKNSTANLLAKPGLMVGYSPSADPTSAIAPYLSGYTKEMDEASKRLNDTKK